MPRYRGDVATVCMSWAQVAALSTVRSVWLDGPPPTIERVGLRGFGYAPMARGGAIAVEPHVLILYVDGRTSIERIIERTKEQEEVGPGDVSLQSAAVATAWAWSRPIDVLHVYISPVQLQSIARRAFGHDVRAARLRNRLRLQDEVLVQFGCDLVQETTCPEPGSEIAIRALGERLVVHLLRNHAELERASKGTALDASAVERLEAYVDEHLGGRLDVPRLARVAGCGVDHFRRVFRLTFGCSPHDYVRRRRVEAAKSMLVATDDGIGEIALACGFSDQSHLTRCFKRYEGATPARWRRAPHSG